MIYQLENDLKVTIREAEVRDAFEIVNLLKAAATESANMLFSDDDFDVTVKEEEKIIEMFIKNKNAMMLVAIVEDKIIGIGTIDGQRYKNVIHNCEVALTIKKDYWGKQIGSTMMKSLINSARAIGKTNITLSVKSDNLPALKLYEKLGFKNVGLYKNYFYIEGKYYDLQLLQLIL